MSRAQFNWNKARIRAKARVERFNGKGKPSRTFTRGKGGSMLHSSPRIRTITLAGGAIYKNGKIERKPNDTQ